MDIFDALRVVTRWWMVTVPILVIGLTGAFVLSSNINPEFQAEAAVLLVGPTVRSQDEGGDAVNPVLVQPAALTTAAEVAALSANTAQVRNLLASEGRSTSYEVGAQRSNPILVIEVRAWSREEATTTTLRIVELIEEDLRLRQDAVDAPQDQRVTTSVIGLSAVGGADYGGRNRARVALAVLAIGAAFGAAFLAEGLERRRRMRAGGTPMEGAARDDSIDVGHDPVATGG